MMVLCAFEICMLTVCMLIGVCNGMENEVMEIWSVHRHLTQKHTSYFPQSNTLVPAQPQVTKGTTTSTSIALSWTSAGSEVDSYEVMWTSDVCTDDVDEGSAIITETSYIIEDLREGTSYTITVSVTNSAGASASDFVTGKTEELGICNYTEVVLVSRGNLSCTNRVICT